jgi:hypothetical protein
LFHYKSEKTPAIHSSKTTGQPQWKVTPLFAHNPRRVSQRERGWFEQQHTKYHSGQLTVERRFSGGLSLLANYTWAKLLDDIGWTNPFYRAFDYGRSRDDLGQSLKLSSIWEIPRMPFKGVAGEVLNGWGLTGNMFWRGGFPFSIRSGRANSLSGIGRDRPDLR